MKFSDIPGLSEIKKKLIRSVKEGKIAHAQLFTGREGAMNLPLAIAYATYLHCTDRSDQDACGVCPACSKNLKFIHPDTHFVFPVRTILASEDREKVSTDFMKSWRIFLREQPFGNLADWVMAYGGEDKLAIISKEKSREIIQALSLKPFESPFKVMIIWQPEAMHPSAANGILKIVEEPPPNTFFLLVTNNAERLMPTILSRTQHIAVPMLQEEEIDGFLQSQPTLDAKKRRQIAAEAEGNPRLALALMESDEEDHYELMANWMRSCFKREYVQLVALSEKFHEFDKLEQQTLLQYTLVMMRETLLARSGADSILRSRDNEQKFVKDFSKVMTVDKI